MNIALILAGGVGSRTGFHVPKQYMTIMDKPVIIYTMQNLEKSRLFDEIYVICSDKWEAFVSSYVKQYNIRSFKSTISAGNSRFETMVKGVDYLVEHGYNEKDSVCILESVRPMVPYHVLKQSVEELDFYDCIVTMIPVHDSLFEVDRSSNSVSGQVDNACLYRGQTPVSAHLDDMYHAVHYSDKYGESLPLTTAMMEFDKKILQIEGSIKSIKITTAEDFEIIKALLQNQE